MNTRYITKASLIAAIYIVLVLIQMLPAPFVNLTFGPIQLRLAEGLTLLPLVEAAAVPGLFVGCLLANLLLAAYSGFGLIDIIGGSAVTLLAAYLTYKVGESTIQARGKEGRGIFKTRISPKGVILGMIPPVALNGLIVSIWVSYFTKVPYIITVLGIAGGELASVIFGILTLVAYEKATGFKEY